MSALRINRQRLLGILCCVTFFGCAAQPKSAALSPAETVRMVAATPGGVSGVFRLVSKSFRLGEGPESGAVYLFSTSDYRFPDCLTIFLTPRAVKAFQAAGKEAPFDFSGQLLEVKGTARRVRARASNTALEADETYDRTQINVDSPNQIRFLPPP